jgi:hypothetical protein
MRKGDRLKQSRLDRLQDKRKIPEEMFACLPLVVEKLNCISRLPAYLFHRGRIYPWVSQENSPLQGGG